MSCKYSQFADEKGIGHKKIARKRKACHLLLLLGSVLLFAGKRKGFKELAEKGIKNPGKTRLSRVLNMM